MKKTVLIAAAVIIALLLGACGASNDGQTSVTDANAGNAETNASANVNEATGEFTVSTSDGSYSRDGNVVTLTAAGTYSLSGRLDGRIVVDAGEDDEVCLDLCGVTVVSGDDSPVKIVSAGKAEISAKSGTDNVITDSRAAKSSDDQNQGEGAIYAKCDLKLKGTGTLVVNAGYNNGVHTTKDLKIQKLTLTVTANDDALRGNDSVTVLSGTVVAVSKYGDGIRTNDTDVSKNGVTRGDVSVLGGTVTVYAAGDGVDSAHDFLMEEGEEGAGTMTVYTGSYSGYTADDATTSSYKGIKVANVLTVSAGELYIHSFDDGLHADHGSSFDDGTEGEGRIDISGGSVTLGVYSPEGKVSGGRMGPGGFGGREMNAVTGADGIHADGELNISGGTVTVDSAYEGLEANVINISGGTVTVSANDDGVNACRGEQTAQVNVTGGVLDVTVPTGGDVDGIDSNGTYSQTGGLVVTKGPRSEMMAALDADGTVSVTGGTLIVLGYGRVSTGGGVQSYSLSLHGEGEHTVVFGDGTYTFTNSENYGVTACSSAVAVTEG